MRILVTGAAGMLGSSLVPTLGAGGHEVLATDIRTAPSEAYGYLDVRDPAQVAEWFERVRPELVAHLAAETDVDLCQAAADHADATNSLGTRHVARACQAADVPLAYVSTAGVFDGKKPDPYVEDDTPAPVNVYGRSKLEGERCVRELVSRSYIVRAGWMVGGGDRDHKFVAKILRQLDEGARTIYAVGDKWGTPTYAPDFARCFTRLIETSRFGLYHMASLGQGTRLDVARQILRVLGLSDEVELVEVDSDFFRESYPAPRPRSEMLRNLRLDQIGLNGMRPWEEAVEEYLHTAFASRCRPSAGPTAIEWTSLVHQDVPSGAGSVVDRGAGGVGDRL